MGSQFDPSEFVDEDFQQVQRGTSASAGASSTNPFSESDQAPSSEEIETRVTDMQKKLAELKQAQNELERERSSLEEIRRRQSEFKTGREEMLQHLTRGVGLMEESEFAARRDAEQMSKTLTEFREALNKIQAIQEETWSKENLNVELTRALTVLENARMEWNSARLKFSILADDSAEEAGKPKEIVPTVQHMLHPTSYAELCKIGLALTWPLVLLALAVFVVLLIQLK